VSESAIGELLVRLREALEQLHAPD